MDKDMDILLADSKVVSLAGKKYEIKKLGLRQIIKLMAFLGTLQEEVRKKIIADSNGDNKEDFFKLISHLSDEELPKLLGILLNSNDIEEMKKIDDIAEISELVVAITEVNDIEGIVSNFSVAVAKIKKAMAKINTSNSDLPPSLSK